MRIGILGSGTVGRTLATKLAEEHEVSIGTRDPDALAARTEPDAMGNPPFPDWHRSHPRVQVGRFADAARHGELLVNATSGAGSVDALATADPADLEQKVLIDVSNPLRWSPDEPPSLFVANTDSLAEQIQRAFPALRVVKSLNTVTAAVMVDPSRVGDGRHLAFVCGNDEDAKRTVTRVLTERLGWRDVVDLGDLTAARATEAYLLLWLRLMQTVGDPMFNITLAR
ncbi:MAG: NAD(P)-binding domain-containing protein [Actinomycetota bacterium]